MSEDEGGGRGGGRRGRGGVGGGGGRYQCVSSLVYVLSFLRWEVW